MADLLDVARNASNRHIGRRDTLGNSLWSRLRSLWGLFGAWGDQDIVSSFAAQSVNLVDAAVATARRDQRSYSSVILGQMGVTLPPMPETDIYPRSGVSPLEVYWRPAIQARYALSEGAGYEDALDRALDRLESLANADVVLADRDESRRLMDAVDVVVGYRRIIHPEQSRSGTCGLCLVASANFYTTADLAPIHDGCHCDTLPILKGEKDPGQELNRADLDKIYETAGSNTAEDLKRTRIQIMDNGELGPVLVREGQNFRTPKQAGAKKFKIPTAEDARGQWEHMRDEAKKTAANIQKRIAAGDTTTVTNLGERQVTVDNTQALKYNLELIARLETKLRAAA